MERDAEKQFNYKVYKIQWRHPQMPLLRSNNKHFQFILLNISVAQSSSQFSILIAWTLIQINCDFVTCVYLSEATSPPRFSFGVVYQFCRFWIWSDINGLQQYSTPLPPPIHTLCVQYIQYCTLTQGRGERESWTREKVRWATVYKAWSKIPTWLTVSLVHQLW